MKINVIVNGISFYTTSAGIKRGVGNNSNVNVAIQQVFADMYNAVGISTTIRLYDHKMIQHAYDIQLRKM
jgi:hypothetical protein